MDISFIVLLFSILVALIGLAVRTSRLISLPSPKDPSPPKASVSRGVIYSFTIGMLPWKKESARLHKLTYLRGAFFHLGIFAAIILLLLSLFVDIKSLPGSLAFSPFLLLGFLAGLTALLVRFLDRNLRALSRPDDYVSLALVSLMLLSASLFVLNVASRTIFWGVFSALGLYLPWSKIPHVVYFFFAKIIFATQFGRRGVLHTAKMPNAGRGIR